MTVFVLVHGSWQDGSAWRSIGKQLRRKGHKAVAPTLAGHGPKTNPDVGFTDYVRTVVDAVNECSAKRVVLVGHSAGGAVVAAAAGLLRHKVQRLVFVASIIPAQGERLIDIIPPEHAAVFTEIAEASPDNTIRLPWEVWRERFVGDGDQKLARATYEILCPEPYRPVLDKIDMNGFETLDIPRSYINCRGDTAFPPGEWGLFPRFFNRLGLCRLIDIDGGHQVMFTAPSRLAAALLEAGRD